MRIEERYRRNMILTYNNITAYINYVDRTEGCSEKVEDMLRWFCAYVILPKDTDEDTIECHGGVTWTDRDVPGFPIIIGEDEMVFGWDYAHACDDGMTVTEMLHDVLETLMTLDAVRRE